MGAPGTSRGPGRRGERDLRLDGRADRDARHAGRAAVLFGERGEFGRGDGLGVGGAIARGGEHGGFFLRAAEDAAEPGGIGAEGWAQGGEGGLARAREFVFGHAVGGEAVADGEDGLGEFGGHGGIDDAAGGDVAVAGKRVARGAVGAGAAGAADLLADFHAEAVAADGVQQGETAVALAVHAGGRGPGEVHMAQRNFGGDGGGLGKGRGRVWFRGRGAFPGWRRRPRRWLRGGDRRGNFDGPGRVVGGDEGGVGVAGDRGNACDHDIAARRGERGAQGREAVGDGDLGEGGMVGRRVPLRDGW